MADPTCSDSHTNAGGTWFQQMNDNKETTELIVIYFAILLSGR